MIHNVSIIKNQWTLIAQMGVWITSVLATGDLRIRASKMDGSVFETELVSGMTFDVKGGFNSISVISSVSQTAKLWISENQLKWTPSTTRELGAAAVNSLVSRVGNVPELLIPASATRNSVRVLSNFADVYIGDKLMTEESAIKIPKGETETLSLSGELFAYVKDASFRRYYLSTPSDTPEFVNRLKYNANAGAIAFDNDDIDSRGVLMVMVGSSVCLLNRDNSTHQEVMTGAAGGVFFNIDDVPTCITVSGGVASISRLNFNDLVVSSEVIKTGIAGGVSHVDIELSGRIAMVAGSTLYYRASIDADFVAAEVPAEIAGIDKIAIVRGGGVFIVDQNGFRSFFDGSAFGLASALPFQFKHGGNTRDGGVISEDRGMLYLHGEKNNTIANPHGIFFSIDNGETWNITVGYKPRLSQYNAVLAVGTAEYFTTKYELFYRLNRGDDFKSIHHGANILNCKPVITKDGVIHLVGRVATTELVGDVGIVGGAPIAMMELLN